MIGGGDRVGPSAGGGTARRIACATGRDAGPGGTALRWISQQAGDFTLGQQATYLLRLFDASTPASATRDERTSGLAAVLSKSDEATILRLFDEDRWRRLSVMERIAAER